MSILIMKKQSKNSPAKVPYSSDSPYKSFQVIKTLGKGSFGEVFRVREKSTNQLYALKKVIHEDLV